MRLGETRLFRRSADEIDEEIEALVESATLLLAAQDRRAGRDRARGRPGRHRRERHAR